MLKAKLTTKPKPKPKLGFLGIGLMGSPMTLRLLNAGYTIYIWNRSAEKIFPLLENGAIALDSPAAVTIESEFVFMCLTDANAVEQVVFDDNGVVKTGIENKILVDFSSISPVLTREFSVRLESECGMGWVDAPVSGGVKGAEEGSLAILAGGKTEAIERVRPIVSNLCNRMTHMGHTGAGQVTKLCNQVIVASNLVTIAEAISLAERSGIDATKLHEALAGGFGDSLPLQVFGPRFSKREVEPLLGHVYTMLKDVDSARELGRETNTPLPMAATAAEMFRQISSRGYAEEDVTNLIRLFGPREDQIV
ncbi:NAD(P)-dependent oxidoreductase [Rhodospirillales bacterium]|nr:NAD(P)-dependent oxidoreductase [Rhodospirillales bacterium]